MILRRPVMLSLVFGLLGCGHAATSVATAEPSPGPRDGGAAMEMEVGETQSYAKRDGDAAMKPHAELSAPPSHPGPSEASGGTAAEPAVTVPEIDPGDRYLVYTAEMTISVFDLDRALGEAEHLPDAFGGYVSQLGDGFLVLRIPSARLRPAMEHLARLGTVESRSLQAQEVTAEFVDLQSRIRALEETQTQLLSLLGKARTVEEALHVRSTLDRINGELEVLKGRLRQLGNLIAYSTLHLRLVERGPHDTISTSNDPFPWVDRLGVEATEWN